jgi:hypothetical protein
MLSYRILWSRAESKCSERRRLGRLAVAEIQAGRTRQAGVEGRRSSSDLPRIGNGREEIGVGVDRRTEGPNRVTYGNRGHHITHDIRHFFIDRWVFSTYEAVDPIFSRTTRTLPSRPLAILLVEIICQY